MIHISGSDTSPSGISEEWLSHPVTRKIVNTMRRSRHTYTFSSLEELDFRLMVSAHIVDAAYALYRSGVSFATFYDSRCNESYWELTSNGGFRLKANVEPAVALHDIYHNGQQYAFECATAMVIVLYKAVLESLGESRFNRVFPRLFLWDWSFDEDLGLSWEVPYDVFPGDVRYVKNPDVNPQHMQFQGENLIDLGNGTFYGHGFGIGSVQEVIAGLNRNRRPGADQSAFLMDEATRPAFSHLFAFTGGGRASDACSEDAVRNNYVTVTTGTSMQIH